MSQEWKQQFEKELQEQERIRLELQARQETLQAELARRTDATDQVHQSLVNEFLTRIQAREILAFIQEKAFGGKGAISSVYTDASYTGRYKKTVKKSFVESYIDAGSQVIEYEVEEEDTRRVNRFLSGIALDVVSEQEKGFSLFIGLIGTRDITQVSQYRTDMLQVTPEVVFQALPPVVYSYDCFGVELAIDAGYYYTEPNTINYSNTQFSADTEYLDNYNSFGPDRLPLTVEQRLQVMRNKQARDLSRGGTSVLHFVIGRGLIPEQAVIPVLRSSDFQNRAQQLAQNRVLYLMKSQFPQKG